MIWLKTPFTKMSLIVGLNSTSHVLTTSTVLPTKKGIQEIYHQLRKPHKSARVRPKPKEVLLKIKLTKVLPQQQRLLLIKSKTC